MLCQNKIVSVNAKEILDSRGNPTVEATVILEDGSTGIACSPSGASTGKYEAYEMRDNNKNRYNGKGTLKAVENVNSVINSSLSGMVCNQGMVDCVMIKLDDTKNKSSLGANAILSVSLASAKAGAEHNRIPLYRYIGGSNAVRIPTPMMNILNGGSHASNNIDIQEFMIVPYGFETFAEALRAGSEIYHKLGELLKRDSKSSLVGDEGGFAPDLNDEREAVEYIIKAVNEAGYSTDNNVKIALDCAASEWASDGAYTLPKQKRTFETDELIEKWERMINDYPIISIEDGLGEDDTIGWTRMTKRIGDKIMLVGDDLFVTNTKRLSEGIKNNAGNAILIKPNQIGTLSETMEVSRLASANSYKQIISHRSGETEDTSIADIAVGLNAGFIKTGAPCRAERTAKYNRLLQIEKEIGCSSVYGNNI